MAKVAVSKKTPVAKKSPAPAMIEVKEGPVLGGPGMIQNIPITSIVKSDVANPRGEQATWEDGLKQLHQAFVAGGRVSRTAICVRARADGRFDLVDGFRRVAVAEKAKAQTIPAVILPANATEADVIALQIALNSADVRHDVNPVAQMETLWKAVDMLTKAGHQDPEQHIRRISGLSTQRWAQLKELKDAPHKLQMLVRGNDMGLTAALSFVDDKGEWLDNESLTEVVAKLKKLEGVTSNDVARAFTAVQEDRAAKAAASETINGPADPAAPDLRIVQAAEAARVAPPKKAAMAAHLSALAVAMRDGVDEDFEPVPYLDLKGKTIEVNGQFAAGFLAGASWAKTGQTPSLIPLEGDTLPVRERQAVIVREVKSDLLMGLLNAQSNTVSEAAYASIGESILGREGDDKAKPPVKPLVGLLDKKVTLGRAIALVQSMIEDPKNAAPVKDAEGDDDSGD